MTVSESAITSSHNHAHPGHMPIETRRSTSLNPNHEHQALPQSLRLPPASRSSTPNNMADQASLAQILQQLVAIEARRANSPAPSTNASSSEPKANPPDTFDGSKPEKLEGFLMQCNIVFRLQPSKFTEESKVIYAISFLRGFVQDAIQPLASGDELDEKISSFQRLSKYLRDNFGDPDIKGTAQRRYFDLKQTGSAAEYFAKLREYLAVLGWEANEQARARALEGLSDNLRDEVARTTVELETFGELQSYVIKLDNRLRAREAEKKAEVKRYEEARRRPAPTTQQQAALPASSTYRPLPPIPSTRPSPAPSGPPGFRSTPPGGLDPAERQRRNEQRLCFRCGGVGHFANACVPGQRPPVPRGSPAPGRPIVKQEDPKA